MSGNNERSSGPGLTPEQQAARQRLGSLSAAEADPDYRARLRRDFTRGVVSPARSRRPLLLGHPVIRWTLAAAALALILLGWANRGPAWQVLLATPGGRIQLDGRTVKLRGSSDLSSRLHAGAHLRTGDSTVVVLASPGDLVLEILPGTDVRLPATPRRWLARTIRASVDTGELRISTQARFHGARLLVNTPEVSVAVTGTTLAVIRPDFGSCICVLEGTVRVAPPQGSYEPVTGGHRFTYVRAAHAAERGDMLPSERNALSQLRRAYGAVSRE